MEGDLLRALASGIPADEVKGMTDKLRWGVALYTELDTGPTNGKAGPAAPAPRRSRQGRKKTVKR